MYRVYLFLCCVVLCLRARALKRRSSVSVGGDVTPVSFVPSLDLKPRGCYLERERETEGGKIVTHENGNGSESVPFSTPASILNSPGLGGGAGELI